MKAPLSWLNKYVDITLNSQDLAHELTMAGIEVGSGIGVGSGTRVGSGGGGRLVPKVSVAIEGVSCIELS